ncbi:hypothetical protein DOTSEDRAFT_73175 [Dothistroma septosporum NZE10]|uniref:Uncharacterized protein n=1 Tax=Dothistroma septosporum (strain NZE10 / CBS 128990) TaxID=675120 RepID=N1PIR2_DOTSN|nr:hypothetical protein DOTSEDRAFT_73175 [Dothistroma septosporum NZE10]
MKGEHYLSASNELRGSRCSDDVEEAALDIQLAEEYAFPTNAGLQLTPPLQSRAATAATTVLRVFASTVSETIDAVPAAATALNIVADAAATGVQIGRVSLASIVGVVVPLGSSPCNSTLAYCQRVTYIPLSELWGSR